ncbi:uncharacterized protein LOC100378467 [Saccoglossus kowalevskii]|uniref:RING-type E3 ubiquitin transferase n=1 Tax=Saccoglossus kowalevskii TaxID=10224 RepID=A0ABM0M8Y8_SACKO|nr:PREDICTED: roquin-1-like [Saccoglossus kowalevskii]
MPIQAPQWTEFLLCPICYNDFDDNVRLPISLVCGHTVCRTCLAQLHRKQCPFDQSNISADINSLPANYALLQLVGVEIPKTVELPSGLSSQHLKQYEESKSCVEEMALLLQPLSKVNVGSKECVLSRPMQRKLVTLVNCQLVEDEGRARAVRAARSLGERTVTELILQHQNPQQLSANLWAAVRARGCQFLGPAMQEECLKLVLLALEDGNALSRKVLVLFVVQRLEPQFPQASKTSVGHVVQLLYRASCFKVTKREEDSSLMQLKEEFRSYEALRREHDSQIVQIAMEAGLRISPEQWSSLLYGDASHKSHMQSIIDKLQTPASFAASVQELSIALQRSGDPANLARLTEDFELLANIDPAPDSAIPSWEESQRSMRAAKTAVLGLVDFVQNHSHHRKVLEQAQNSKYKTSLCRDVQQSGGCPRAANCTFAHSPEELERFRAKSRRTHIKGKVEKKIEGGGSKPLTESSNENLLARGPDTMTLDNDFPSFCDDEMSTNSSPFISPCTSGMSSPIPLSLGRNSPIPEKEKYPRCDYSSVYENSQAPHLEVSYKEPIDHRRYSPHPTYSSCELGYKVPESRHLHPSDPYYKSIASPHPRYVPDDIFGRAPPSRFVDDAYHGRYVPMGYNVAEGNPRGCIPSGAPPYAPEIKGYTRHLDQYPMYRQRNQTDPPPPDTPGSGYSGTSSNPVHRLSMYQLQDKREHLMAKLDPNYESHQQTRPFNTTPESSTAIVSSILSTVAGMINSKAKSTGHGNRSLTQLTTSQHLVSSSGVNLQDMARRDTTSSNKDSRYAGQYYNPWSSNPVLNIAPPTTGIPTISKTIVRHVSLEEGESVPGFGRNEQGNNEMPPKPGHDHHSCVEDVNRGRRIRREMEQMAIEKQRIKDNDSLCHDPKDLLNPIKRMSKSIFHETDPVQAMPTCYTPTTAVMAYQDSQMSSTVQQFSPGKHLSYEDKVNASSTETPITSATVWYSDLVDRVVTPTPPVEKQQIRLELQQVDKQIRQKQHDIVIQKAQDTLILHREEQAMSAHKDPYNCPPSINDELLARKLQEVELGIQKKTLVEPSKSDETVDDVAIATWLQQDEMEGRPSVNDANELKPEQCLPANVRLQQQQNDHQFAEQLVYQEAQAYGIRVAPQYADYHPRTEVVQPNYFVGNGRQVPPPPPPPPPQQHGNPVPGAPYYYPQRVGRYVSPCPAPPPPSAIKDPNYAWMTTLPSNVVEDPWNDLYQSYKQQ